MLQFISNNNVLYFQVEQDAPVSDASPHIANIGRMVEVLFNSKLLNKSVLFCSSSCFVLFIDTMLM